MLNLFHREIAEMMRPRFGADATREARYVIQAACDITPEQFLGGVTLSDMQQQRARDWAMQRVAGMPLSRLKGVREFYGLEFVINEATLDPRPDSEVLVEQALKLKERYQGTVPPVIVDFGTGSGCLLIAILANWPEARGIGIDLSANALQAAQENAVRNGVAGRAMFVRSSWGDALSEHVCQLLISNPPYIPQADIDSLEPEVKKHDPILALEGGIDGLDAYKNILAQLKHVLTPGGHALFEIGQGQADDLTRLVGDTGANLEGIHLDSGGIQRVVGISYGDKSFFD